MTEKIYLKNPYITEINARIVEKKYSNNKFYLKLDRTIFYPNLAGGQPGDKGTIAGVKVIDTYEENNDIIHIVNENIDTNKVQLSIDWDTRLDYMQQHTGQHLLSSVFYKLYSAQTLGFHIGEDYVYIDITIPELKIEDIERVEIVANKIIYSNFSINTYIVQKNDLDRIPLREKPIVDSNIRIVEIDDIDYSPCCGTHLRNTGEIGMIKIRKSEKYKENTRVEFVCGNRALKDYSQKNLQINNISALLSINDTNVYEKVEKLYTQKEKLEKENRILKEELLKYKCEKLTNKEEL